MIIISMLTNWRVWGIGTRAGKSRKLANNLGRWRASGVWRKAGAMTPRSEFVDVYASGGHQIGLAIASPGSPGSRGVCRTELLPDALEGVVGFSGF